MILKKLFIVILFLIFTLSVNSYAEFGKAPKNWGDFRVGLVSDGDEKSTARLHGAVKDLGIKLSYRYRYINEGVDPAKNACQWAFPKPGNGINYSQKSMELTGTEASFVIYVLQEEGGTTKLLNNINNADKMRLFFQTLRIVGENANGHGATIIVEPDTWGYLLQDKYGTIIKEDLEDDPTLIPAQVNNLRDSTYFDTIIIPDWQTGNHDTTIKEVHLDWSYLSDLPNNLAGLGRGIIRTLHKFAPDCYVGFLASHWSVNIAPGWSTDGLVWATPELRDTSAKINIRFFEKLYWGSIDDSHPKQPGDDPDFIGVEKNGWCAGRWEWYDNRMYWYWGDDEMINYLSWVKQIGEGLNLPVVGWQISIGNMSNQNTFDETNMANSYKDTYFPYFFNHVNEFLDAGLIGFLVGKGLSQGTDYTLPSENIGEKGWFFNQLVEFDKKRPYLDTSSTPIFFTGDSHDEVRFKINNNGLHFNISASTNTPFKLQVVNIQGKEVMNLLGNRYVKIPKESLAKGFYIFKIIQKGKISLFKIVNRY